MRCCGPQIFERFQIFYELTHVRILILEGEGKSFFAVSSRKVKELFNPQCICFSIFNRVLKNSGAMLGAMLLTQCGDCFAGSLASGTLPAWPASGALQLRSQAGA